MQHLGTPVSEELERTVFSVQSDTVEPGTWMDVMPVYTAQAPNHCTSVQEAHRAAIARHQQAAGARAPPPALLAEEDAQVLKNTAAARSKNTGHPRPRLSVRPNHPRQRRTRQLKGQPGLKSRTTRSLIRRTSGSHQMQPGMCG